MKPPGDTAIIKLMETKGLEAEKQTKTTQIKIVISYLLLKLTIPFHFFEGRRVLLIELFCTIFFYS